MMWWLLVIEAAGSLRHLQLPASRAAPAAHRQVAGCMLRLRRLPARSSEGRRDRVRHNRSGPPFSASFRPGTATTRWCSAGSSAARANWTWPRNIKTHCTITHGRLRRDLPKVDAFAERQWLLGERLSHRGMTIYTGPYSAGHLGG